MPALLGPPGSRSRSLRAGWKVGEWPSQSSRPRSCSPCSRSCSCSWRRQAIRCAAHFVRPGCSGSVECRTDCTCGTAPCCLGRRAGLSASPARRRSSNIDRRGCSSQVSAVGRRFAWLSFRLIEARFIAMGRRNQEDTRSGALRRFDPAVDGAPRRSAAQISACTWTTSSDRDSAQHDAPPLVVRR